MIHFWGWTINFRNFRLKQNSGGTKGIVFFYFPGKVTFRMIFGKKEWVSEISGIFFFHSGGKKNTALFLTEKKIPGYFSAKLSISDRKKQRYFSKLSTPIFLPKLWITDEKTKIIFWPKLGISDGNKKIPPYFCKNCLFLAEIKKYPLFLPKPSKSCAGKKKIPRPTKRSEWVPSVSFPGKKKIRHLWLGEYQKLNWRSPGCVHLDSES